MLISFRLSNHFGINDRRLLDTLEVISSSLSCLRFLFYGKENNRKTSIVPSLCPWHWAMLLFRIRHELEIEMLRQIRVPLASSLRVANHAKKQNRDSRGHAPGRNCAAFLLTRQYAHGHRRSGFGAACPPATLRWQLGSGVDSIVNWAIGLPEERPWRSGIVSLHSWHGCILPFARIGQALTVNYDLGHSQQMPCVVRSPNFSASQLSGGQICVAV